MQGTFSTGTELISRRAALRAVAAALVVSFSPALSGAQSGGSQDGIDVDHYYRLFPRQPDNVKAEIRDGGVVVSWDKPAPPPAGKLGYDPAIARYHVYRLGRDQQRTLIGKTTVTWFKDLSVLRPGTVRRYGVTVIPRTGEESILSNEAELRIPSGPK